MMSPDLSPENAPTQADFNAAIEARASYWYSACLRITRNPQLAEDAVQDALLSAWSKRSQFKRGAKLETWIHSIAVNSALSLLRKQHPERSAPLDTDVEDASQSAETAHHYDALHTELDTAMGQLTRDERLCFVLKHLEDWKLNEIAEAIGKNANTVKQTLFRGVRKLRNEMPTLAREVQ